MSSSKVAFIKETLNCGATGSLRIQKLNVTRVQNAR